MSILRFLQLPYVDKMKDLDDPATTIVRSKIIQENIFLKNLYTDFYNIFKDSLTNLSRKRALIDFLCSMLFTIFMIIDYFLKR